jgi:hypothetical protein
MPKSDGDYSLRNSAFTFMGHRLLGDFSQGKNGQEIGISIKHGRLVSNEVSRRRTEVDVNKLLLGLNSYFGQPQVSSRQVPEIFPEQGAKSSHAPRVTISVQTWISGDAIVEYKCNQGLCTIRGIEMSK